MHANGTACDTGSTTATDANAEVVDAQRYHNHFGNGITCNMSTFFRHPCFWIVVGAVGYAVFDAYREGQRKRRD